MATGSGPKGDHKAISRAKSGDTAGPQPFYGFGRSKVKILGCQIDRTDRLVSVLSATRPLTLVLLAQFNAVSFVALFAVSEPMRFHYFLRDTILSSLEHSGCSFQFGFGLICIRLRFTALCRRKTTSIYRNRNCLTSHVQTDYDE